MIPLTDEVSRAVKFTETESIRVVQGLREKNKELVLSGKESAANAEDMGSLPGLGRPSGEGNGNPLQHSCLGNPNDRGDWQATVLEGHKRVGCDLATKTTLFLF